MIPFEELLQKAVEMKASDLHITVGVPPIMRVNGMLNKYGGEILTPDITEAYVKTVLDEEQYKKYLETGESDSSYSLQGYGRYRVNVFKQRGSNAMVLRIVASKVPTLDDLAMPQVIREFANKSQGLVLVTGPTGSGKSTTLAAIINEININKSCHIITLEDPVEYLHRHGKSIVNQREVGHDTKSYGNALRAALREDPDVILVGEMRDLETISIALTAAETGHLVFSTLHTIGASKTMDRVVDVFPPHQQQQIKTQLAGVLEGVVSQKLIPKAAGEGRVCALEIMVATPAIKNLVREGKTHQIDTSVQTGSKYGMKTMDSSIVELYRKGLIDRENALSNAIEAEVVQRMLNI